MEYNEPGADNQFKPGTYSRSADMEQNSLFSVMRGTKKKAAVEAAAQAIFTFCGFLAVLAVGIIVAYMIASGTPALAPVWHILLYIILSGRNSSGSLDRSAGGSADSSISGGAGG